MALTAIQIRMDYEKAKAAGANGVWQKEISETSFIKACAFL
jgi:hypothetical protein